jgi:hypothetical protein
MSYFVRTQLEMSQSTLGSDAFNYDWRSVQVIAGQKWHSSSRSWQSLLSSWLASVMAGSGHGFCMVAEKEPGHPFHVLMGVRISNSNGDDVEAQRVLLKCCSILCPLRTKL